MTQQKREKERRKQEKAQRKREQRELKKFDKDTEVEEEELVVLDGPTYFKDFDMSEIKI